MVPRASIRFLALFEHDPRDATVYRRRAPFVRYPRGAVALAMLNLVACTAGFIALARRALTACSVPTIHDAWFLGHLLVTDAMVYEYSLNGRVFRGLLWVGVLVHLCAEARLAGMEWETIAAATVALQQLVPINTLNLVAAVASAFDVLVMGYFWEYASDVYWWSHFFHGIGAAVGELVLFIPAARNWITLYVAFQLALLATSVNVVVVVYNDDWTTVLAQYIAAYVAVRAYRARFTVGGYATKYERLVANNPVATWSRLD